MISFLLFSGRRLELREKTKSQKFNKEGLINKLKSEFNKFKDFGIDLNEANKTANKAKLATKKAENAITKGIQDLKEIKDKEKAGKIINKFILNSKKFKELRNKQWHISGLIKITKIYNHSDSRGKEYKYDIEEKDGGIYKGTKDEAIEEFKKEMFIKYNRIDPSPEIEYIVKEIIIGSIIQVDNKITNIEDIPMRQATQLDYNIIDEYKDFLQNNGTCVVDNFMGKDRAESIYRSVVSMYHSGVFVEGETVSSSLDTTKKVRSDKITWVDGSENNCENIAHLISTIDTIIMNSIRMKGNGQLGQRTIGGRTKV